jgi:hypothetical protein
VVKVELMSKALNASDAKPRNKNYKRITKKGYAFIVSWTLVAILVSIVAGYHIVSFINQVKLEENTKYHVGTPNIYNNSKSESLQNASSNSNRNPTNVQVGVYVDHIKELDIKDSKWTMDFFIWFAWHGNGVTPGKFHVINGYVDKDDNKHIYGTNKTGINYELYEVVASTTENFDPRLYPLDDQYITIKIEDIYDDINFLKYIPDKKNSTISDRVNLTGFEIINYYPIVRSNEYATNFGIPIKNIANMPIFSQFNFIILIHRSNGVLLFFKLFQGLIVAVFVSMLAFFIKPTWVEPRFGLGIGGLFAAVANNYIVSSELPIAGTVTLASLLHGIGITIIFFSIVQSVLSLYIYDNLDAISFSKLFDRVSFVVFAIIFIAIIAAIIW